MKKMLVIGIGSRIMADDGIGVYLVEELLKQEFMSEIEYIVGETDLDYCLNRIYGESNIVIIDAVMFEKEPGTVSLFKIDHMDMRSSKMFSAHNYSLIEAAIKQLHNCTLAIIGIEPQCIDFQFGLSDTLSKAFPHILKKVKRILSQLTSAELQLTRSKLYHNTNHRNCKPYY